VNFNIAGHVPKCVEPQLWSCCSWLEANWQGQATKKCATLLVQDVEQEISALELLFLARSELAGTGDKKVRHFAGSRH